MVEAACGGELLNGFQKGDRNEINEMLRTLRSQFSLQLFVTIAGILITALGDRLGQFVIPNNLLIPHGMCFRWNSTLISLHVVSDITIAISYFAIPFILLKLAANRSDLMRGWAYAAFSGFIFWCGMTHVMNVVTIWWPKYWIEGMVKATTAVTSIGTVFLLGWFVRHIMSMPTHKLLEEELLRGKDLMRQVDEYEKRVKEIERERGPR
jgi:hypothetical protein